MGVSNQGPIQLEAPAMRGSLLLTMTGNPGPRGWTDPRPRIEPDMTRKKKLKKVNEVIPNNIPL